jgi:protein LTV1
MGKTKKFIDKKNSSTYHVLYRSQRDVGEGPTVLWPATGNDAATDEKVLHIPPSSTMGEWKAKMAQVGLVDDYDYEKHMRPITGSGDFFGPNGHRADPLKDARAHVLEDEVQEVERQLDSIALTPDCMDEDIALALFGDFDEGGFEEILDDFCVTAAQEPEGEEEEKGFDFDAHVQSLIEKARLQEMGVPGVAAHEHDWGRTDAAFFGKGKALRTYQERDDDDDDESGEFDDDEDFDDFGGEEITGVVPKLSPAEEKALCDKFEMTLAEYDSDEVGELDNDVDEIRGDRELEGDSAFEAVLDEYLEEKEDEILFAGTVHLPDYRRKCGFHSLEVKDQQPEDVKEVLAEAKAFLASPALDLPPEEILIDGKSYYSQKSRNPWDCESILSTYSNLDNNPAVVENSRRKGNKKKKNKVGPQQPIYEETVKQIQLSKKTGLPLGILPSRYGGSPDDFDTIASVNKGEKRSKEESSEEKKMRKALVQQQRQLSRIQKKMMKEAFQDEFSKRNGENIDNDVAGKSVFRYS